MTALSAGGRTGRHLEAVEAAPGDAHHADRTRCTRPDRRSRRWPRPRRSCSCFGVFVVHQAVGLAVAAHVDPEAGIAVTGEIGMGQCVPSGGAVALAVGQVLQDRRDRALLRICRQPDPRRQTAAVRERDPAVLDLPNGAREVIDDAQTRHSERGGGSFGARDRGKREEQESRARRLGVARRSSEGARRAEIRTEM